MKTMSNVIRMLFAATAVVTITVLFPPRQQMPAQDVNRMCIGGKCILLDAFQRCDGDPCGCPFCVMDDQICCVELPGIVVEV